jgi:hypothetical protein
MIFGFRSSFQAQPGIFDESITFYIYEKVAMTSFILDYE